MHEQEEYEQENYEQEENEKDEDEWEGHRSRGSERTPPSRESYPVTNIDGSTTDSLHAIQHTGTMNLSVSIAPTATPAILISPHSQSPSQFLSSDVLDRRPNLLIEAVLAEVNANVNLIGPIGRMDLVGSLTEEGSDATTNVIMLDYGTSIVVRAFQSTVNIMLRDAAPHRPHLKLALKLVNSVANIHAPHSFRGARRITCFRSSGSFNESGYEYRDETGDELIIDAQYSTISTVAGGELRTDERADLATITG